MEVRPGYKLTEVGVIPEDWDAMRVCEFGSVITGGTPRTEIQDYWNGSYPWVTPTDITDHRDIWASERMISELGLRSIRQLPPNSVLVTCIASIGKNAILRSVGGCNQQINAVVPLQEQSPEFLYYSFEHSKQYLLANAGMTATRILSKAAFEQLKFPIPPPPEQRAIATALSDVDALLGGLDRLIAKKRDLKQAAMQQLLTGQTRLPGFSGEWEVKRLGDHVTFLRHGVNSRAELLPEGRVKYLHYGEVHACKDVYLSPTSLPCLPEAKAAALDRLRDGDLVFADASEDIAGVSKSVEIRGVGSRELVSGLHTIAARFDRDVLADGFKGFLQYCPPFSTHLRRLAAGTKVYATNRAHIASVEMRLPSVAEQAAISAVLSDMDAEIAALEARRDKTRDLKQAMMQELLTGKTRLVKPEAAHA